jgi:N-methylhydantoinase A/oxoprolinase/acetone carboxylase beta subunit
MREGFEKHPEYESLKAEFGEENAEFVVSFMERWRQHYTRAAYIDMGFPDEAGCIQFTREMAEIFGWNHEVIKGDPELMRQVLAGDWSDSRVFVLPANSRSCSSGDDKVFACSSVDGGEWPDRLSEAEVIVEAGGGGSGSAGIGLGIDAGGTYTDAVIYDLGRRAVLAKAKSLTTYHNLVEGIRGALAQLPPELLEEVEVTSLSTTLATNSIVEGRGHKVGLIALSPWGWTEDQIGHQPLVNVPGAVSITGEEIEPLDEAACREAVKMLVEKECCAAVVVAGYATVRNPSQANRVREIVMEMCDMPVVCSHEMSRRLNAIHAAQTAIANARLLPVIRDLIAAVHQALGDFHVPGRLMVVKGDGTPVDESIARARPVETILSGPAASVSGARILTGADDALVIDIGGTTTDCAIVENGHVAVSPDGARIGSWTMSVDAVEISTAGLGGDSRIDFNRDRRITIGPVRCIPFAYLARENDSVKDFLDRFDSAHFAGSTDASAMDFLVLGANSRMELTAREQQIVNLLREEGPTSVLRAAKALGLPAHTLLPTARLEACGMVKRAALTPTDLLHVSGAFTRWDSDAARQALEHFAVIYGRPADEVLENARTAVTRRLFEEIIRREVSCENRKFHKIPRDWEFLLTKAFADDGRGLGVAVSLRRPIVAIGAPAQALAPAVAKHLRAEIIVPEHADVANAVGAIGSEISVREEIIIRPGQMSNYVLHGSEERIEFSELDHATARAVEIARARARTRALEAGASAPEVTVARSDRLGSVSDGGHIFLERRVTAVASGGAFGNAAVAGRLV